MKRGRQLILYGAGGHGAVVEAAIIADGTWKIAAVLDDGRAPGERLVINVVNGGREQLSELFVDGVRLVHVSIGDNLAREVVCTMMRETGFALQSIQHPRAY
ncbi:pilin glycosylation protein, partial [bacterium]|nr:pilin glycosylation protein [bacterium]